MVHFIDEGKNNVTDDAYQLLSGLANSKPLDESVSQPLLTASVKISPTRVKNKTGTAILLTKLVKGLGETTLQMTMANQVLDNLAQMVAANSSENNEDKDDLDQVKLSLSFLRRQL